MPIKNYIERVNSFSKVLKQNGKKPRSISKSPLKINKKKSLKIKGPCKIINGRHSDVPKSSSLLEKSCQLFFKTLSYEYYELMEIFEKKNKKNNMISSSQNEKLKTLKKLIKTQRTHELDRINNDKKTENINKILRKSSEDLSILEKKCEDLTNENLQLRKIFENCKDLDLPKQPHDSLTISSILQSIILKRPENTTKISIKPSSFSSKNYANSIDSYIKNHLALENPDFSSIIPSLALSIENELNNSSSSAYQLESSLHQLKSYSSDLQSKLHLLSQ